MARRDRQAFRSFSDNTTEIGEAAVQVALGLGFAGVGVYLFLVPDLRAVVAWTWLAVAGGVGTALAAWAAVRLGRHVHRMRALHDAVPGTATVTGVRPTGQYADEWKFRRYIDVDLLVTLPGADSRPMRARQALSEQQQAGLQVGTAVTVRAHPVRPVVQLDLAPRA